MLHTRGIIVEQPAFTHHVEDQLRRREVLFQRLGPRRDLGDSVAVLGDGSAGRIHRLSGILEVSPQTSHPPAEGVGTLACPRRIEIAQDRGHCTARVGQIGGPQFGPSSGEPA
ncbi:hypothetical protein ACIP5T_14215 [Microbacterium sp. NPDC088619]|uniref:hypothetical protein n=1 Tax=Microbacterium sp. NPDC088619 TaxID=3364196 RepID=UPI0038280364